MATSTVAGPSPKRSLPLSTKIGLGVVAALTLLGAVTSGVAGAAIFLGLTVLVTGLWHAAIGRSWLTPLLPQGRKVGVGAIVASVLAMGIGGVAAPASDDPAPVATPASPSTTVSLSVADGTAMAALAGMEIKGRVPKTGYKRDQFEQQCEAPQV